MNKRVENYVLDAVTQEELVEIHKRHVMFLTGKPGGSRAVIKDKDFSALNFEGARFEQADFTGCVFRKSNMKKANFKSATLFGCDFSSCDMQESDFSKADLRGADIQFSNMTDANFSKADLREGTSAVRRKMKTAGDEFGDAKAGHVTFNGSILYNVSMRGVTAINADFSDAIMDNVDFEDADLRDCQMKGANLNNANLNNADIRNANFFAANLTNTTLDNIEKAGAKFKRTLLDDEQHEVFNEVELSLDELVEKHTQWVGSAGRHGEQMNLSNYDMRKLSSLAEKKLTAIVAEDTVFADMNLQSIGLQSAKVMCSDFRQSDMRHADCRGAQMNECIFVRANLQKSNFGPLLFKGSEGQERKVPCNLKGAIFRYADCRETDFRYANLKDADLTHADFSDCDLRYADFTGATLEATNFENALTLGAKFDRSFDPETASEDA